MTEFENNYREVVYPGLYRHFKNKFYATMGFSIAVPKTFIEHIINNNCTTLYAEDSDDKSTFLIYKYKGEYYHNKVKNRTYVLYKTLFDETGIKAREIEEFRGLVDKEKYPESNQKYRYELVRN